MNEAKRGLEARYTRRKQWITGIFFFLSSTAAATEAIVRKEKDPSESAASEAPNDRKLLGQWQDRVFSMYHLTGQHG